MSSDFIATFALIVLGIATISVLTDIVTYTDRQDRWESEHPGARYVRGYRKMKK